jgi:hypothetical protein
LPNEVVTTLKGDGAAPWIVIHTETPEENEKTITDVMSGLLQTAGEASALFAGAVRVANGLGQNATQDQQTQQQKPPYQPRQQVQQNRGYQQQSNFNGTPHPEGKTCPLCNAPIVGKQPKVKKMWTCPNQKQSGDGHYVEWIND